MVKRGTQEEFLNFFVKKFGNNFDFSELIYINTRTAVIIKCKTCNTKHNLTPHYYNSSTYGCNICGK